MVTYPKIIWLVSFLLSFNCPYCFSQINRDDSLFYQRSISNLSNLYKDKVGAQLCLFNGTAYFLPQVSIQGFPFFETDSVIAGTIVYNGNTYNPINMQYDIAKDEIVIEDYTQAVAITLIPEKVTSFTLNQHHFIRITPGKATSNATHGGYYELLLDQPALSVLEKRTKFFKQSLPGEEVNSRYIEANTFYIKRGGELSVIRDKADIIYFFKDQKAAIKQFIKDNAIKFNRNTGTDIINVVKYYLGLKNKNAQ